MTKGSTKNTDAVTRGCKQSCWKCHRWPEEPSASVCVQTRRSQMYSYLISDIPTHGFFTCLNQHMQLDIPNELKPPMTCLSQFCYVFPHLLGKNWKKGIFHLLNGGKILAILRWPKWDFSPPGFPGVGGVLRLASADDSSAHLPFSHILCII